jgi:N-acyl homoserine lactone hydrolase
MKSRHSIVLTLCTILFIQGCSVSTHATKPATLGTPSSSQKMEALIDQPDSVEFRAINSADWQVPLSGLLNLKDPQAVAAGLQDHDEAIQVFAYLIHHPKHGYFLIDTGVSEKLVNDPAGTGLSYLMRKGMGIDKMKIKQGTAAIIASLPEKLSGVFFTHLHLDHISGMPDIANDIPLFAGAGEIEEHYWLHAFVQGSTDRLLDGKATLQSWQFAADADQQLSAVIDIFADGSVFAIKTPGHTAGSTAYLVRSDKGPVLITGDTSHTSWGWEHTVAPGDYTRDQAGNLKSLQQLKALAARHPRMAVYLGHQYLPQAGMTK